MKPLLRIWHFFRGHPADDIYAVIGWEGGTAYECERCGKAGRRL